MSGNIMEIIFLYKKKCKTFKKFLEKIKKIWVTLDETTDTEIPYGANVIVGSLELNFPRKYFLMNTEILEKVNHSTIKNLFYKSFQIIWFNGIKH